MTTMSPHCLWRRNSKDAPGECFVVCFSHFPNIRLQWRLETSKLRVIYQLNLLEPMQCFQVLLKIKIVYVLLLLIIDTLILTTLFCYDQKCSTLKKKKFFSFEPGAPSNLYYNKPPLCPNIVFVKFRQVKYRRFRKFGATYNMFMTRLSYIYMYVLCITFVAFNKHIYLLLTFILRIRPYIQCYRSTARLYLGLVRGCCWRV